MFEKAAFIIVALVGGYGSITGTLPAAIIALFGNPSVLTPVQQNYKGLPNIPAVPVTGGGSPAPVIPPGGSPALPSGGGAPELPPGGGPLELPSGGGVFPDLIP